METTLRAVSSVAEVGHLGAALPLSVGFRFDFPKREFKNTRLYRVSIQYDMCPINTLHTFNPDSEVDPGYAGILPAFFNKMRARRPRTQERHCIVLSIVCP